MAKHVIIESYTFTPATRTVVIIGKNIRREQLLLITNTTTGTVLYNFSDPALSATSYVNAVNPITGQETTTIILSFNTTAMSATDKISILTEESYQEMIPAEVMRDPVDKLRVSTPQSLIDTDFEYGQQPTKWESLVLMNNRPSAAYDATQGISNVSRSDLTFPGANANPYLITGVSASGRLVSVSINNTTGITVGLPIFIQGTLDAGNADGWWIVESVTANTLITFSTINTPAASLYDATKTILFIGAFFTGAGIPTTSITLTGAVGTVTTTGSHGLQVGNSFYIAGTTGATGTLNSTWTVATTPTNNTFTFTCTATGSITLTAGTNATLYPRAMGFVQHRPFDGGVQFSNVSPFQGYQVIRQTRRQFRYQSGKGIQFSTGSILKPAVFLDNLTSSGTTVTVTTKYPHGLLPGATVRVAGAVQTAYNGNFTVVTAPTALTFTYTALSTPAATPATGWPITIAPNTWFGSSNRVGMFDSQNGFYFEFDGQQLYCVRRSSTSQISGSVAVTNGSASITGTGTKFAEELIPGDFIVIRGKSYIVQTITSNTQAFIYPEYRGVTSTNCVVSKTINTRIPQSSWNIDKLDGTGHSLMNLDLSKMQMFYIDYTWYGAGAIRFGFKNTRGEVVYCHRMPNNNVNTEAYMRSGNLPARYETNTLAPYTFLTSTLSNVSGTGATISVSDVSNFPPSGTIFLTQAAATGGVTEYITYSAKVGSTGLVIAARGQTGGSGATTFTYSATAPIHVELYSPQCASTISHWGSSIIMDGRYDDDKSLVFNAGNNAALTNLSQNVRQPILSLRIAPTVDNGLTGLLGLREIVNRMQLTLRQMDVFVTGTAFRIEIFLNGRLSGGTFNAVGGSSLAQVAYHTGGQTLTGGESIFGFFTSNSGSLAADLSQVRDIGNSILGGGNTNTCPNSALNLYPDGPDIITICATNITSNATNTINSRLSWTEAQA
jgi:hypothetical protein